MFVIKNVEDIVLFDYRKFDSIEEAKEFLDEQLGDWCSTDYFIEYQNND